MSYFKLLFPILVVVGSGLSIYSLVRGKPQRILAVIMLAIALLTWPPAGWLVSGTLEWPYMDSRLSAGAGDMIVVLSGGAYPPDVRQPYPVMLEDTVRRSRHAAWLYHNWKQVRVLVCGPGFRDHPETEPMSASMADLLVGWGVPESQIIRESRGGSTYTQAVAASQILRNSDIRRIALVTDAAHMRRAAACFRRQGIAVSPAPCGFRSIPAELALQYLLPSPGTIAVTEGAVREWVALAVYWFQDRI